MAWQETPTRVVVEFLRSNQGTKRVIALKHTPQAVPPQLQGRVDPNLWGSFMSEVQQLAASHPYTQRPTAGQMGRWGACFCVGAVLGVFCADPDAGDYAAWESQAHQLVSRHATGTHPLLDQERSRSDELIAQCSVEFRDTQLDHFSWANDETFKQRYFVCDKHYRKGGPIFFYLGNEADVTLYLNNSGKRGLTLAPEFGALLVFAEHRYYGQSAPFRKHLTRHMQWLTTEQAMGDYAELIWELRGSYGPSTPVVGFGGSYGGMLAAWFRIKYPHLLNGAIAGSAPIWTFLGEDPAYDAGGFAATVTRDASPAGGAAAACVDNVKAGWKTLFDMGKTPGGRSSIAEALRLCPDSAPKSEDDVLALAYWLQDAWDYLAMGDYPYPSGYMLNGGGVLPAYPVRAACSFLAASDLHKDGFALLRAVGQASGVFFNHSGQLDCFDWNQGANPETEKDADFWGYQACTEQFMPFSRDGIHDMFWDQPFDAKDEKRGCKKQWGVRPRPYWPTIECARWMRALHSDRCLQLEWWGGRDLRAASNIVFSNGLLDPCKMFVKLLGLVLLVGLAADEYQLRSFICDQYYQPGGPIFFVPGGEANIEGSVKNMGWLWEIAPQFNASMIFIEHRYWGKSFPQPAGSGRYEYLTVEQAMGDYAEILFQREKDSGGLLGPVIAVGGSYPGMLAAWMRIKYPHLVTGAIGSSAPFRMFFGQVPEMMSSFEFLRVVTEAASPKRGSAEACAPNVKAFGEYIESLTKAKNPEQSFKDVAKAMNICGLPATPEYEGSAGLGLVAGLPSSVFTSMAQTNFPMPTGFSIGRKTQALPAWPVREACNYLADPALADNADPAPLLRAMGRALNLNFNPTSPRGYAEIEDQPWGYLVCAELQFPDSNANATTSMFMPQYTDFEQRLQNCVKEFNITSSPQRALREYGGARLNGASNVYLTNGDMDPWYTFGVLNNVSETVTSFLIKDAAHHADLMDPSDADPPSVEQARELGLYWIRRWIAEAEAQAPNEIRFVEPEDHEW
ncbi:hypothetical protein QBZ16_003881 [Prototheca wickerhamii]|uniref:Uncharacterized protein n=1 Tax=Prototheca wickerhamii TaxID=3111 RepID=A0AAD9II73_PROWI|nr:hypothetical protein QBZ16_003881 [Prototheca wickerhamii]